MPDNINIKSDDISPVARGQAVVEARQPLDKECRVLSVCADAVIIPGEVFAGEARYTGKVKFDTLVLCDGKIECVSSVAEFSDKISSSDITTGMNPVITFEIVNTEANIEGGALKTTAVIDTSAYAVKHCDFTCVTEQDEGVYAEKRTVEYCTALSEPSETAYITDSISDVKAEDVLFASSNAVVTGSECGSDEVKLSGAVYTVIVVKSEDGLAASYKLVTPFVKSISAPGVVESNIALPSVSVTDSSATLAVEGDERSIELAVTLNMCATVLETAQSDVAVDVFCADNELEVTASDAKLFAVEPYVTVIDSVDGQVALGADRLAADNVICVTNTFAVVSDAKAEDRRVTVDGLVGGDIVYYNAEKNAVESIAFRLPFSMPLSLHTDKSNVDMTAKVTDVGVKIRRESVFDVKAEIAFSARLSTCETVKVIENVKIGEPIQHPDATVMIHIAKPGETLWQAAKALGCSPDRVSEQNSAAAPYAGGERLVNYCIKRK